MIVKKVNREEENCGCNFCNRGVLSEERNKLVYPYETVYYMSSGKSGLAAFICDECVKEFISKVEKLTEFLDESNTAPIPENIFHSMDELPELEPGETFSKDILVYDKDEPTCCERAYYDFESKEWIIFGEISMKLICWSYPPDPTEFLKGKKLKHQLHRGYC